MKLKTPPQPMLARIGKPADTGNGQSRLKATPPREIVAALVQLDVDADDLILSICSDINLLGRYEPQWLVATDAAVWVFDQSKPDKPAQSVTLEEVEEFRTVAAVGSGILQAKVGEIWLDLIRYSNRQKYYFSRAAKRLEQLREEEKFDLSHEDDHDPRRCPSCGLMLSFQGETCPRCLNRGAASSRVLQLMRPYAAAAVVMMVLLLLGIVIDMGVPLLTRYLVDEVLSPVHAYGVERGGREPRRPTSRWSAASPNKSPRSSRCGRCWLVVAALACFQIVRAAINIYNGRLASRVATSITFDIRGKLVEHLEKLSLSYYDKQSTGSLVGRVAYDTEAVQDFMTQLTSGFLMQIIMVVAAGFVMFSVEPHLAVWALLPAPFVVLGATLYYRWVYPRYNRMWDRQSKQANMISGILTGIRVVKAFNQEQREFDRFQKSSATLRDARRSLDVSAATYYPIFGLVFTAGGWIVWYVGGKDVLLHKLDPYHGLTLGTLLMFMVYMAQFYAPLQSLTSLTSWLTGFSTQMHRIFEVLDTPISVPDAANPARIPVMRGDIEFQNVVFGYSRQSPILKNVSFDIKEGQMIGVVGRSGSGKTTIINLISRFYDVDDEGRVLDRRPRRSARSAAGTTCVCWQIGVACCMGTIFLFRGTLWQNMVYGRHDASVEEVIAASRAGTAHDFMMRQMHAYDTWVGERRARGYVGRRTPTAPRSPGQLLCESCGC